MNRARDRVLRDNDSIGGTRSVEVPVAAADGSVFHAEVYTSIDVAANPELRRALTAGDLNRVETPGGETIQLAVPVIIHDPESRRFGLHLPEALRHRMFDERRRLLSLLENADGNIPAYMLEFDVVLNPGEWLSAEATADSGADVERSGTTPDDAEIADEWREIEEERDALDTREAQLEEVRDRIDRERRELEEMRDQLEQERQELEAEQLRLEDRERRAEADDSSDEVTQVVTDDQFVEVTDDPDAVETPEDTKTTDEVVDLERPADASTGQIESIDVSGYESFEDRAEEGPILENHDGEIVAAASVSGEQLDELTSGSRRLYVQLHHLDDVPLAAVAYATLDDDGGVRATIGWPIDVYDDTHRTILNRLSERTRLTVLLFGDDGESAGFRADVPLESNVEWIRSRVEEGVDEEELSDASDTKRLAGACEAAANEYLGADFERVGSMTHNFDDPMFQDAETPSELKLATSVLGYWSEPEQFEYLVANRSYPLEWFREMRTRIVRRAVETGIYLPESLRDVAIEQDMAADETELFDRLLSNFSEVSVQLRDNDLDAEAEWENWDSLLEAAKDLGVSIDQDVVELAEASLKRAREQREMEAEFGDSDGSEPSSSSASPEPVSDADIEKSEVIGKESDSTGVTYFLPESAVIDTFDDLADVPRDDLEKLLSDANGRLEAAQMLIERFGASTVPTVLDASERMTAAEVSALAAFVESKARGLEQELKSALREGGASSVYIAARGLAEADATEAIPDLLEAYGDPERRLNRGAMARTLATFENELLEPLVDWFRRHDTDRIDEELWAEFIARVDDEHKGFSDRLREEGGDAVDLVVDAAADRPDLSLTSKE